MPSKRSLEKAKAIVHKYGTKYREWAPWVPVEYTAIDVGAIHALVRGDATSDQQKRAWRWILETAAGTYLEVFHPDHARWSDFAMGRRFVGTQMLRLLAMSVQDAVNKERAERGAPPQESEQPP